MSARMLDVHQSVPVLMLGLAVIVTLIPGKFDLSVSGVATLTTFAVVGLTVKNELPFPVAVGAAVAVGLGVGLINGVLVEYLNVNAFIATLGTGAICTGLAAVYSNGAYLGATPGTPDMPTWFRNFGTFVNKPPVAIVWVMIVLAVVGAFFVVDRFRPAAWSKTRWLVAKSAMFVSVILVLQFVTLLSTWVAQVSWMLLMLLLVALTMAVLLQYTTFGRQLQAIGSNRSAAALAGVRVRRQVVKSFVLGGFLAALAGISIAASQGSASPDVASAFLLPAFAAAFLSTVVFSDGRFTVGGTIIGGVFVVWVGIGLIVGGLPSTWTNVINGGVLIGAVSLSTAVRRRRT
ncbi:ABC transporter permease [Nocardioides immobilis]|uniref:ABC transporter permease n=1 Tax=Nocardioides immobilis TaxID=2049295 RepID=UPI0015FAF6F5|nr:ABC transporter permease [Nocardioides immobilis]